MRSILAAALIAVSASATLAGGLAPVDPDCCWYDFADMPQPSSWGVILPILGAVLLIGLASSGGPDDADDQK